MSYRFSSLLLLAVPLLSIPFISLPAFAQSATTLDSIVVTATRTPLSADKLLSSVSVVTRQDIERYNYQNLADAISSLPGVSISNSGGLGKLTSLFLRGTESNHTQILLNGVKLATNVFGTPQLEHIPLSQIDRIELVRGPQSSLYGSESIGGTIQIFTKKGMGSLSPHISVGFGTHNTKETTIGVAAGDENNWFSLSGSYSETDGFNACHVRSGTLFIGCFATEPDNDAYRNASSSLRTGHRFENNTEVEIFSLYSEGDVEYDGYFNTTYFLQHTFGTNVTFDVLDNWSITTSLSQGRIESDNRGAIATSFADNKQNNFSLQNNIQFNNQSLLTLGYDYENDKITESSGFTKTERDNNAIFAQLLGETGKHHYRLALRGDDNEQFGGHTTGNIAWGTKISDTLRANVSFGTAFAAPSLIDLYSPYGGNSALDPARSKTVELGIAGDYIGLNWSANIFQTKIKDLINLDAFYVSQNISEARIVGLELQADTRLMGINLASQFSWIDPKNKSGKINDGKVLARRAKHTFTLNAHKAFGDFSLASKVFTSGQRYDDAANTRRLAAYATVDLIGSYQINTHASLRLKVSNLFDEKYETVSGYNTDGKNIFLSFHYQP